MSLIDVYSYELTYLLNLKKSANTYHATKIIYILQYHNDSGAAI